MQKNHTNSRSIKSRTLSRLTIAGVARREVDSKRRNHRVEMITKLLSVLLYGLNPRFSSYCLVGSRRVPRCRLGAV